MTRVHLHHENNAPDPPDEILSAPTSQRMCPAAYDGRVVQLPRGRSRWLRLERGGRLGRKDITDPGLRVAMERKTGRSYEDLLVRRALTHRAANAIAHE